MFGISQYKDILNLLKQEGMTFSKDWNNEDQFNTVLLRHDIDFSVAKAHELALFEMKNDVYSTFFFMLTSNMYNLLSEKNRYLVKEILEMGHKISLHFDPTAYNSIKPLAGEQRTFEETFGVELDIISIHRPGEFLRENNRNLLNLKHTYQDQYFKKMTYISDSGGKSVHKSVLDYLSNKKDILHLLLHPIWWTQETDSPTSTLESWRNDNSEFIVSEIRKNCKTYTK